MPKETQATLRTRHINCSYCIALSLFLLSIVLFALSAKEENALGNAQSRTPVIIAASIILVLAIFILVCITYYAIGYFRFKKHEELNRRNQVSRTTSSTTTTTQTNKISVVIFDNAAFTMDDPLSIDTTNHIQTST